MNPALAPAAALVGTRTCPLPVSNREIQLPRHLWQEGKDCTLKELKMSGSYWADGSCLPILISECIMSPKKKTQKQSKEDKTIENKTSLDTRVCHQPCTGNAVLPTGALSPHPWPFLGLAFVLSFSATNSSVHRTFPTSLTSATIKRKKISFY